MPPEQAVAVLDNGAYLAKVGLSNAAKPAIIPNCIMKAKAERRRAFIGNQIDECRDASGLFYLLGFQRGYLLNWDIQKSVWDHIFSAEGSGIQLNERNLIITEPQLNFSSIQEAMMEILFEEFHCAGIHKTTAAELAAHNYAYELRRKQQDLKKPIEDCNKNCLIIDAGYSFTHVVPFVRGRCVYRGIRRIDVGGKMLTNHLKELISYRHLNMMDESYVVNQIKEDVCFVSQNLKEDMRIHSSASKRAEMTVEYVLPDFTTVRRGYIRGKRKKQAENDKQPANDADQQFVRLCNERFTVPELLFNPSDIGIPQVGLPHAIVDCLKDCPSFAHCDLLQNILLIGGSAHFPGFAPRLKHELQALVSDDFVVEVTLPDDPIAYAWHGGKRFAATNEFKNVVLTRDVYEEQGYAAFIAK